MFILVTATILIYSCKKDPSIVDIHYDNHVHLDVTNFPPPNIPADNELTKEGVMLGRMLFTKRKKSSFGRSKLLKIMINQSNLNNS